MTDMVNHPPHYGGDVPHEVYKCLEAWGLTASAYLWNAVKYIGRAGKKGDVLEDLKKAKWYLEREIERLDPTRSESFRKGWAKVEETRKALKREFEKEKKKRVSRSRTRTW